MCDRLLLPISAKNSAEAIDTLFKSHFVIGTQYDTNLIGLWKFLQVYLYKLHVESTELPRKVKGVYTQLFGILNTEAQDSSQDAGLP